MLNKQYTQLKGSTVGTVYIVGDQDSSEGEGMISLHVVDMNTGDILSDYATVVVELNDLSLLSDEEVEKLGEVNGWESSEEESDDLETETNGGRVGERVGLEREREQLDLLLSVAKAIQSDIKQNCGEVTARTMERIVRALADK